MRNCTVQLLFFADGSDGSSGEIKALARSIDLNIRDVLDAIATRHPGLLIKFGGHAMAAGLSIKRVHLNGFVLYSIVLWLSWLMTIPLALSA